MKGLKSFKKTVLIDDDVSSNMVFEKLSKATNLTQELITIISPVDALTFFESISLEQMPDSIFLDINMPILSGWDFLHQFKGLKKEKTTKVFLISGSINYSDIETANKEKMVLELLSKPISISDILNLKKRYA